MKLSILRGFEDGEKTGDLNGENVRDAAEMLLVDLAAVRRR